MQLPWIDPSNVKGVFPPVGQALKNPNGLLAAGGDLSTARLLEAYSQGIFPWYNPNEPILWWSPDPRCVFFLERIHTSRSLRRALAREDYSVTLDHDFAAVIEACAAPRRSQGGTWLGSQMRNAYLRLHAEGYAHSVEAWRDGELIGGLYGVSLGNIFFGESMFSDAADGSKIALVWLARQLIAWGFELMDCQVGSGHLYRMGAIDLPRAGFMEKLALALRQPLHLGHWIFEIPVPAQAQHLPSLRRAI